MTINDEILDGQIAHMVWLERYKSGTVRKIISTLNKADNDLVEKIAARLTKIQERGYDIGPAQTERLKKLLDEIRSSRVDIYKALLEETREELNEFAIHEADYQKALIDHTTANAVSLEKPSLNQLKAVVSAKPFQGRLLKEWYEGIGQADGLRVADAIRIGITEGQTTDEIVRRIKGTRSLKYADGILETNRRAVQSVVRTAIAHTANVASEALYEANSDIIAGVKWISTLDGRTSAVCRARDGMIYDVGQGPRPPAHFGCRSRTVPYLGETSIKGTRASEVGPVPADTTYREWLRKQPEARQNKILGPTKAKLFRSGKYDLDRFVDNSGREYSLSELKAKDAKHFADALA